MERYIFFSCLITLCAVSAKAFELPEIVSDGAVLQQQADARLWGWTMPGTPVMVTPSWEGGEAVTATAGADGRFDVSLPTPAASMTPHTLTFTTPDTTVVVRDVLVGEVWLCSGQSNMEMPLRGFGVQPVEGAGEAIAYAGRYPHIRMANIPKRESYSEETRTPGRWQVSSPAVAAEFSALAYFFARSLSDIIGTPVGIINCAYGGASVEGWTPRSILDTYPGYDMAREETDPGINAWERIGVMYNAMLRPLAPYTVKGFLWNQGESNVGRHDEYPSHQLDMVSHWRTLWGNDSLPFYFVELPPWSYSDPDGDSAAYFREAQHRAASITPHSGIVCTTDLIYPHELEDVHASRKQPIGERLAWMAAARTYGVDGVPHRYPSLKSVELRGDTALITIEAEHGGLNPNLNLEGFEVAGDDRVFHQARASEDWNTFRISVTSDEVPEVKAVRYCFKNFSPGTLKGMTGLPLIPFRTDGWEYGTAKSN